MAIILTDENKSPALLAAACNTGVGSTVVTNNSPTVDFSGSGVSGAPLSADVNLSQTADNALVANVDGLFVKASSVQNTVAVSNDVLNTVVLSGTGAESNPLKATVKVDPAVDNAIQQTANGLKVNPTTVSFSSQTSSIIENGADGKPGAFIQKEEIWEAPDPLFLVGNGNTIQKLGARLQLSGDPLNALERHFANDTSGRPIAGLYAKQETSELAIVGGLGVNNTDLTAGMIRNKENGRIFWIGKVRANASSGGLSRPTVTVTGPASNLGINVSGGGGGSISIPTNSITSTGTVTNLTPTFYQVPLPTGYTWLQAMASCTSATDIFVMTTTLSTATANIYTFHSETSVGPQAEFLLILCGYDPAIANEFGPL